MSASAVGRGHEKHSSKTAKDTVMLTTTAATGLTVAVLGAALAVRGFPAAAASASG